MSESTLKPEAHELFLFALLNSASIEEETFLFHIIFHSLSALPVILVGISCYAIPQ